MSTSRVAQIAAFAMTMTILAACAGGGNKAGGPAAPVVLKLATVDGAAGSKPAIDDVPRRIEAASNGNVRIEFVFHVGEFKPDAEEQVVRGVEAGTYDLGVVGTRVFDTLGVNSFQALSAPMLIDTYELEAAVLKSAIPERMLGSLDRLHVSGLGVLADGLRKPIGVDKPLVSLADWRGIRFGTFRSDGQAAAIRALGAEPVIAVGPGRDKALENHEIQAFELNLMGYEIVNLQQRAPYVTANINLWPGMYAVIGNPARLDKLTAEQRDWLTAALRDTAASSVDLVKADVALADLCRDGSRFANASDAEIDALREAVAPVYTDLERDALNRQLITQIRQLAAGSSPAAAVAIPDGCTGPAPGVVAHQPSGVPGKTTTVTPLDGTWETSYTYDDLATNPLVDKSEVLLDNAGTFAMGFDRGDLTGPNKEGEKSIPGTTYVVQGDTLTLYAPDASGGGQVPPPGPAVWKYRWSIYNDVLTFEMLGGKGPDCSYPGSPGMCEPSVPFIVKPWHRIK